ncbi:MAG: cell division transport system permease protein [Acidimicrobiaceae bacterium]|jgi:cell division transport system permease protein|nr:cell division transport system permease protein [Acidimicrobiaceae bacterium]MDQ1444771.1 cell division transport system permease protein [Acidimicrobiaceae bacterium]
MALSLDYVVRETASNLRRNLLMTTAAVLTVAVSLSLFGGSLLLKRGIDRATIRWRGGVDLSIFLDPKAPSQQADAIERKLAGMPEVKRFTYYDHQKAFDEFKEMFKNSPEEIQSVTAEDLPTSYRIVPKRAEDAKAIADRFRNDPGVIDVALAQKIVDTIINITDIARWAIFVISGVLLLSASLLILNTIRMAIFARRREVAVMKLVGATNWFIRVPFMLEGMVQGLAGAAVAFGVVVLIRSGVEWLVHHYDLGLLDQVVVSSRDAITTGSMILVIGGLVGAVGSFVAVRRFLDV